VEVLDDEESMDTNQIENENFNLKNKIDLFEKDIRIFQTKYLEEKNRLEKERQEKAKKEQMIKYLNDILFLFRLRDFF